MVTNRASLVIALTAWLLSGPAASSQMRFLTLEQAGSRTTDFIPKYEGQEVAVVGQVSLRPLSFADSNVLPIQDSASYGLLLEGSPLQFEGFGPGDWIQTRGSLILRAGMPVLAIRDIQKFQTAAPPLPRPVSVSELNSHRFAGVLITLKGAIAQSQHDASGDLLRIQNKPESIDVFLPKLRSNDGWGSTAFQAGDQVRVTGVAAEYATAPPYNCCYRVLVPDSSCITVLDRARPIPYGLLLGTTLGIGAVLLTWLFRERRMGSQRRRLQTLNRLVEEVASAQSPAEILSKLNSGVPRISEGSNISLYLFNRGSKQLQNVGAGSFAAPTTIRPEKPDGPIATGVALCLRNRTLLAVPDTRRSPFFDTNDGTELPRAVMFVPMFAQSEFLGVMQVGYSKKRHVFGIEEQTAMQHLANQVGTTLRLQDQKSIREQLFRSERLAAGGQLISGVASGLRDPLYSILDWISDLKERPGLKFGPELEMIRAEAQRASEIVERLISFGKIGQMEAQPVDITSLLLGLIRFRTNERKQKGVEILPQILNEPVMVIGSQGQLEQVFLNLLVHAEHAAAEARDNGISISTSLLGKRILVEISYYSQLSDTRTADPFSDTEAEGGVLGLGLCRAIARSHGGEIRLTRVSGKQSRFEVDLPLLETGQTQLGVPAPHARPGERTLTFLALEPEPAVQKSLIEVLSRRGHRVVPVASADEGAELVRRLKFDASICSTRISGMMWADFYERIRTDVDCFVLLTDGYDADLAKAFRAGHGFVLSKPIDPQHLERVLDAIEQRVRSG